MSNKLTFDELSSKVLEQLRLLEYKYTTLSVYRRTYNRVKSFMRSIGVTTYTEKVGVDFLRSVKVCKSTMFAYRCAIRRLNDFINGKPYICHVSFEDDGVPEKFKAVLDDFICECEIVGNRPATIKTKRHVCTRFLQYLETSGCTDLAGLDTEVISQSLSIYTNRDNYACLRLFLAYLYDMGITTRDFSLIVPRYKRRKPVPTAYTPAEVLQIEGSINDSSAIGKRNLAIVRLASRMGFRSGDIAKLKWSEIDFHTGYISIIQEKTEVPLTLQMPNDVVKALKAHASTDPKGRDLDGGYVFHQMAAPYDRISTAIVRHAVNDAIVASGIDYKGKKHGPHALRSSLASSMVNDGEAYETVRHILGHSDPDIIKHYAKADIDNLRRCSINPPQPSGSFKKLIDGEGAM